MVLLFSFSKGKDFFSGIKVESLKITVEVMVMLCVQQKKAVVLQKLLIVHFTDAVDVVVLSSRQFLREESPVAVGPQPVALDK